YLFLQKDFDRLNRRIGDIGDRISEVGADMATWASQGAETWHDNFGYEEGVRQEDMLAHRGEDFEAARERAEIVTTGSSDRVAVGSRVTLQGGAGERRTLIVSSYWVLDRRSPEEISYAAPLVAPFMGAGTGEERRVSVPEGEQVWRVTAIDAVDLVRLQTNSPP
ncbi:MAG TPA: GreA/GreB family elongation factor, partial [Kaistia sp.]|nr:GreA/GreB family elongation factor [Kaistia sp.]